MEFSFDSGGLVRGALNEGNSSPINIQLVGKNQDVLFKIADKIKAGGAGRRRRRRCPRPPEAERSGADTSTSTGPRQPSSALTQDDIMKSVIAATNSSITYNKKNFWIDPKNGMQYFVGVQYPEAKIQDESATS